MPKLHKSEGDINISSRRDAWQKKHLDSGSRALLAEDAGISLRQSLSTPCLNTMAACGGIFIEDMQGRRYMDFHGNNVHQVGFGQPSRCSRPSGGSSASCRSAPGATPAGPAVELAEETGRARAGCLGEGRCSAPGGAEAIEHRAGARAAPRAVTGRLQDDLLVGCLPRGRPSGARRDRRRGDFSPGHGPAHARHGARTAGGRVSLHLRLRRPPDCDMTCARYVEYILEKEGDVAAVIAEPIRSTPTIPKPEYWQTIRRACDRHGALLIFDEIPHSLGRTGRMFTFENFGVVPDMVVIGKGLGGGVLPLAALIVRADLDVAAERALGHYTHEKNPVLCAAALATIEYIETHSLVAHARDLGRYSLDRLKEMQERHPLIGDVRGLGLFLGIELVKDRQTRERASDEAEAVMYAALSRGLSFKTTMGNILTLTPPLIISREEMDRALAIIEASIAEVEQQR